MYCSDSWVNKHVMLCYWMSVQKWFNFRHHCQIFGSQGLGIAIWGLLSWTEIFFFPFILNLASENSLQKWFDFRGYFWLPGGLKMSQICGICIIWKVFIQLTLNLSRVLIGWVFRNDSLFLLRSWRYCSAFWRGKIVHKYTNLDVCIAGTLGCVFIDNETHESGVTKCTTGEAWSAFSWHHSSVFHCQWTHNQVFLLLSHMLI